MPPGWQLVPGLHQPFMVLQICHAKMRLHGHDNPCRWGLLHVLAGSSSMFAMPGYMRKCLSTPRAPDSCLPMLQGGSAAPRCPHAGLC